MEPTASKHQINTYIMDSLEEDIKRIALELHEGVGQNLYSILTGLQFAAMGTNEPQTKNQLEEMTLLIEKTIQEIRMLSVELHPPALSSLGLVPAMKNYIKLYTSTFGILVDLQSVGTEKAMPDRNRISIFRVCQEALANIAKYADTSNVEMKFNWNDTDLTIIIKDFGSGFNPEALVKGKQTYGLEAMKERILLIGGQCMIFSKLGEGTTIEISLPLN